MRNQHSACTVCVDYGATLAVTLPRNRPQFDRFLVATTPQDEQTREVCRAYDAEVLLTRSFYDSGALFNKWKGLEELLDVQGRTGWVCLLDADTVLPGLPWELEAGCLHVPHRRMAPWTDTVPDDWTQFPRHRNTAEHAGYAQMFHCDDAALGAPPWHQLDWTHAGGADSFFQRKWLADRRRRQSWDCLHLGEAGVNWAGVGRSEELRKLLVERRRRGDFSAERLPRTS